MRIFITILLLIISTKSLSQFEKDKQAHMFAGMATASLSLEFSKDIKLNPFIVCIGSTAIVGTAKELWDSNEKGNRFDALDLGYTILGGFISYILYEIGLSNAIGIGMGLTGLGLVFNL